MSFDRLQGATILVTGAANGIGKAATLFFLREKGARLTVRSCRTCVELQHAL